MHPRKDEYDGMPAGYETRDYGDPAFETEYEPEPRRERRGRHSKKQSEFSLLFTQIIICMAAILVLFGIKALGGDIYKEFRRLYIEKFNDSTSTDEIMKTISRALEPKGGKDSSSKKTGSSPSSGTESSDSSSSGSDSSPAQESGSSGASTSSAQSGAASDHLPPEEEGDAAFVQDYTAVSGRLGADAASMNTMLTPVSGRITSGYGYRIHPVTGVFSMHGGLDLGADMGTPISAAEAGTVLTVSYSSSYGNYLILQHSGGLQTLYAHCSSVSAKKGETIQRGQTIAKVGSTGVSTGPHLHFEVRINGTRINPEWVLKRIERV